MHYCSSCSLAAGSLCSAMIWSRRFCQVSSVIPFSCNTSFLLGIVLTCTYTLTLTMHAHAFDAPASRRIIGYQCKNPRCGKVFANIFAYEQHRNHASRAGTLCASIMMCEELTGVRRADRSTAVLIAAKPRFRISFNGATSAQRHAHVAVPT